MTLDGYQRQLRLYILPDLGPIALRSLRTETIEACYERLLTSGRADGTAGLSTKSVLEVPVLLRQILDDAVSRGLRRANPARHAVPPRHRRDQHQRRMAWTAPELSAFLNAMVDHRHHRTWWLAAHTGVRRSELMGLRWRDLDLEHRRLSITRTIVAVNGRMHASNGKTINAARTIDLDERTVACSPAGETTTQPGSATSSPTTACSSATTASPSTGRASPKDSTVPLSAPGCSG